MKYELGGSRRRSLGFGVLTGSALEGGELVKQLQSNLEFRMNSAMDMLSGSSSMTPLNRRRELMNRRRELLNVGGSSSSDSSGSSGSSSSSRSRGSGRITDSGSRGGSTSSTSAGTPSMSDVNVGTKARAEERGFDG